jgi:hypothetical protein
MKRAPKCRDGQVLDQEPGGGDTGIQRQLSHHMRLRGRVPAQTAGDEQMTPPPLAQHPNAMRHAAFHRRAGLPPRPYGRA